MRKSGDQQFGTRSVRAGTDRRREHSRRKDLKGKMVYKMIASDRRGFTTVYLLMILAALSAAVLIMIDAASA